MFRALSLAFTVLACCQSVFSQSALRIPAKIQFNFNLKDSQTWSAQLQKIDLTQMQVGADHEVGLMQFRSSDGAFQVDCLKMLKGATVEQNRAACRIQTDSAISQPGITEFQSLNNGQVQKINFHDAVDLENLNRLVGGKYDKSYETRKLVPVTSKGQTSLLPMLTAECQSEMNCLVTIVPGN